MQSLTPSQVDQAILSALGSLYLHSKAHLLSNQLFPQKLSCLESIWLKTEENDCYAIATTSH